MGDGTMWSPQDDDHRFYGAMTLRYALAQSRNVVAVKLAERLGIDRVIEYAKRMGIKEKLEPNLSLALGSEGISPLEQATGYATLANAGIHIDPSPIRLVKDSFGSIVLDNQYPQQTEVVSAGTAFVMTQMLTSVITEGTGYPNAIIGRPAAGKTGTTTDFRDAWFVGYTPDLVAAVWFGNDNYSRMNESYGGNIPARVWARFMKAVARRRSASSSSRCRKAKCAKCVCAEAGASSTSCKEQGRRNHAGPSMKRRSRPLRKPFRLRRRPTFRRGWSATASIS